MNDTPETDAQLTTFTSISKYGKHFENRTGTVSANFARKLEQERDQWRECAENLATCLRASSDWATFGVYVNSHAWLGKFDRLKGEAK